MGNTQSGLKQYFYITKVSNMDLPLVPFVHLITGYNGNSIGDASPLVLKEILKTQDLTLEILDVLLNKKFRVTVPKFLNPEEQKLGINIIKIKEIPNLLKIQVLAIRESAYTDLKVNDNIIGIEGDYCETEDELIGGIKENQGIKLVVIRDSKVHTIGIKSTELGCELGMGLIYSPRREEVHMLEYNGKITRNEVQENETLTRQSQNVHSVSGIEEVGERIMNNLELVAENVVNSIEVDGNKETVKSTEKQKELHQSPQVQTDLASGLLSDTNLSENYATQNHSVNANLNQQSVESDNKAHYNATLSINVEHSNTEDLHIDETKPETNNLGESIHMKDGFQNKAQRSDALDQHNESTDCGSRVPTGLHVEPMFNDASVSSTQSERLASQEPSETSSFSNSTVSESHLLNINSQSLCESLENLGINRESEAHHMPRLAPKDTTDKQVVQKPADPLEKRTASYVYKSPRAMKNTSFKGERPTIPIPSEKSEINNFSKVGMDGTAMVDNHEIRACENNSADRSHESNSSQFNHEIQTSGSSTNEYNHESNCSQSNHEIQGYKNEETHNELLSNSLQNPQEDHVNGNNLVVNPYEADSFEVSFDSNVSHQNSTSQHLENSNRPESSNQINEGNVENSLQGQPEIQNTHAIEQPNQFNDQFYPIAHTPIANDGQEIDTNTDRIYEEANLPKETHFLEGQKNSNVETVQADGSGLVCKDDFTPEGLMKDEVFESKKESSSAASLKDLFDDNDDSLPFDSPKHENASL